MFNFSLPTKEDSNRHRTSWLLMKHSAMLSTRDTPCSRFPDSFQEYAPHIPDLLQWIRQICSLLRVHPSIWGMWSDHTGSSIWSVAVEVREGRAALRKHYTIQLQYRAFKFQSFRGLSFSQTFTACFQFFWFLRLLLVFSKSILTSQAITHVKCRMPRLHHNILLSVCACMYCKRASMYECVHTCVYTEFIVCSNLRHITLESVSFVKGPCTMNIGCVHWRKRPAKIEFFCGRRRTKNIGCVHMQKRLAKIEHFCKKRRAKTESVGKTRRTHCMATFRSCICAIPSRSWCTKIWCKNRPYTNHFKK